MSSLGIELSRQQERVRALVAQYRELHSPPAVNCLFAIALLERALSEAEQASASGDVIAMIRSYERLKECE